TPDPSVLGAASDLMGLEELEGFSLESLLTRQNTFAQSEGITVEMLELRMQQLESMVEARRVALNRMASGERTSSASVTVEHAMTVDGQGVQAAEDIATEGTSLVSRTADQAEGMHRRIAKALGIKRQK
ncbi:MAG: hypothetical protein AAF658_18155, partial [Myxococcota bacterium]